MREHYKTNCIKKGTSGSFFGMKDRVKLDNMPILPIFGLII